MRATEVASCNRQFNVDDLILNTAGAILGWLNGGAAARLLPANDSDHDRLRYGQRVTFPPAVNASRLLGRETLLLIPGQALSR